MHSNSKFAAIAICIFNNRTTDTDPSGMTSPLHLYFLFLPLFLCEGYIFFFFFQPLMKELDEMEKINAKLSAAVEEVTLEHRKKNEVSFVYMFLSVSWLEYDFALWAQIRSCCRLSRSRLGVKCGENIQTRTWLEFGKLHTN